MVKKSILLEIPHLVYGRWKKICEIMENNREFGDFGENIARLYLESKGCKIVEQNYRFLRREIDIIAKDGEYIVFIEVKTRTNAKFGTPAESVNLNKQKHIISAAKGWLLRNKTNLQPRFDIIEIYRDIKNDKNYVRRIENAFILTNKNNKNR
jgi:putative endonuclease